MDRAPLSMGETFRKLCPEYLHYGMTWDDYWHGDPWMVVYYAQMHRLQIQQRNEELWWQGFYNYVAFSTVLANAFASKGAVPKKYLEKPIDILPKTEEEKAAEEEMELRKTIKRLNMLAKQYNANAVEDSK